MAIYWGKREKAGDKVRLSMRDDDRLLADFLEAKDGSGTAEINGVTWNFTREDAVARATDGHVTFEARAEEGFRKAKKIFSNLDLRDIDFINEQKSDWILDENDVKLGQFTGANHGVRNVTVDLEPNAELDDNEKVFLAWVARIALEERMVASNWVLSLVLLIVSVFSLFVFFL